MDIDEDMISFVFLWIPFYKDGMKKLKMRKNSIVICYSRTLKLFEHCLRNNTLARI
jgi:hypothetical protein